MARPRSLPIVVFSGAFLLSALLASMPFGLRLQALADELPPGAKPMAVYAHAIPLFPEDPDRERAGKLTYLGGLVLSSPDPQFGGYSGLLVDPSGTRFLAQSDRAFWFEGDLVDSRGHISNVKNTVLAPMLGADGKQLTTPRYDAESIALRDRFPGEGGTGDIFVGFETVDRVDRYRIGRDGFLARPIPFAMPADIKHNVPNKGLEGIVMLQDGRLLAITERTLDAAGNCKGWIVPLDGRPSSTLTLKHDDPFDLTDLARGPDGDIYALERRYTPVAGPGMRIRRIKKDTIVPGAVLDGEVLIELGASSSIDNMEGLSVRKSADGRTLLYVISDDNQSAAQRTVLLEFQLDE